MAAILVTGFEPYAGFPSNPACEAMRALDGAEIAGLRVAGRLLPVAMARLGEALSAAIAETDPLAVISLGLAPGEPVIRIERVGLNLANFAAPDNDGARAQDRPVSGNGPAARLSTLPVRAIERALLHAGIPARLSETAGTYLCNACLYAGLGLLEERGGARCGFLHLPFTPELAAARLLGTIDDGGDRHPPPSMELGRMIAAVRLAVRETAELIRAGCG